MITAVTGHWEGLDGLGEEALQELRPEAEHNVLRAAIHLVNAIKVTLTGERSGRTYKVSKTGRLHVASAPGEPPAVLYGNLRNSIGMSAIRWEGMTVTVEVGVGLGAKAGNVDPERTYARRLELGGLDSRGVRILPRPYIEPTVVREEQALNALLEG